MAISKESSTIQETAAPEIPRLQLDSRLGRDLRLVMTTGNCMQIPEEIRECVVFLGYRNKSGSEIKATAFLIGHQIEETEKQTLYLVTARHCIDEIHNRAIDNKCRIRANVRGSGATFIDIPLEKWIHHEDDRVDVAITPFPVDLCKLSHRMLSSKTFLTDDDIQKYEIGPGDDLFFPGLFTRHFGDQANIPIMRAGNIAAMPHERIQTNWGNLRAYLAEARSIGGLSGSPVFVHLGSSRSTKSVMSVGGAPKFFLLGLVHGHYGVAGEFDVQDDGILGDSAGSRSINMGIAIVVPVDDIQATLNHPALVSQRAKMRQQLLKKMLVNSPRQTKRRTSGVGTCHGCWRMYPCSARLPRL